MATGCEFLSQIETSEHQKIGCPFLATCDGRKCTNPDPRVRKVVAKNEGKYFTNEDATQEQYLRTLQNSRYTRN